MCTYGGLGVRGDVGRVDTGDEETGEGVYEYTEDGWVPFCDW